MKSGIVGQVIGGIELVALAILVTGCASSGWDSSYDSSVYRALRNENPEAYAAHARRLQLIIEYAERHDHRPPPGICLEYAFYLARLQRQQEAMAYLEKELSYYPEAAKFVVILTRLLQGQKNILDQGDPTPTPTSTPSISSKSVPAPSASSDSSPAQKSSP